MQTITPPLDRPRVVARHRRPDPLTAPTRGFDERYSELFQIALAASYRVLGDRGRSEDVAQEALVRAMTRWDRIENYVEPWVSRVATNLAIDEWRRTSRVVADDQIDGEVSDDALRVEQRDAVTRALGRLPDRQRQAIVLRLVEGYAPKEAAVKMGIAESGVLKHVTRALGALRAELRSGCGDSRSAELVAAF